MLCNERTNTMCAFNMEVLYMIDTTENTSLSGHKLAGA